VLVKSFIITADEAAAQWYSLLSPGVIRGWDDLKQRILSNFQGFQRPELTKSDLLSCKQKDKEPLQNYFRRFVHLRAQAPNVLDVVAINVAIVGLRAGQFHSHLMRQRPKTIHCVYEEFEKYCRSDNDFRMCMEEKSQQKLTSLAKENGPIPETPRTPIPETCSALTVKMPRRTPIHRLTPKAWFLAHLVHHIRIKGAAAGAAAKAEVAAGAEAIMRKENGIASSIRKTMIIVRIIVQTRKDSRPSLKRKGKRRRELVP
jgi:hypothetical protein